MDMGLDMDIIGFGLGMLKGGGLDMLSGSGPGVSERGGVCTYLEAISKARMKYVLSQPMCLPQ